MSELRLLTSSRLHVARRCRREHYLAYELGYRPAVEEENLRFGSLIHKGLEAWWLAKQAGKPVDDWLADANAATLVEADEFDRARAQVLLTGYHLRWSAEPYEVLAVEAKFRCPLINPLTGASSRTWELGGKLDVLVRDLRDNLVRLVEHKTSSDDITPGSDYWKRLRMDGQVSVYFEGAKALGYDIAGCLYDVLGKPGQRPGQTPILDEHGNKIVHNAQGERVRTAQMKWRQTADSSQGYVLQTRPETAEEFKLRYAEVIAEDLGRWFARGEVVRLEQEMADAMADVWQLSQELNEAKRADRRPRNPDACVRWGRTCPYFGVCTGEASLDDPTRFTRVTDVHPELAGDAAA